MLLLLNHIYRHPFIKYTYRFYIIINGILLFIIVIIITITTKIKNPVIRLQFFDTRKN